MATTGKIKPTAVKPKEEIWYIATPEKQLKEGTDYYPSKSLEEALDEGDGYIRKDNPIYVFEVKYIGEAQINVTIKK